MVAILGSCRPGGLNDDDRLVVSIREAREPAEPLRSVLETRRALRCKGRDVVQLVFGGGGILGGEQQCWEGAPEELLPCTSIGTFPKSSGFLLSPTSPQNIRYSLLSSTSAKRSHFLLYAAYDSGRSHSNTITIAHPPGITRIPHFLSCAARTVGVLDAPLTFGAEGATSRPAPYSQVSLRRVPKAARCKDLCLAQLARDRHPSTHRRDRRAPARLRRSSWRSWPIPHFPAVVYQHG
jgi:hypothetical protein